MNGPGGWYAIVVAGQVFGLFPRLADAQNLAQKLRLTDADVQVLPVTDPRPLAAPANADDAVPNEQL